MVSQTPNNEEGLLPEKTPPLPGLLVQALSDSPHSQRFPACRAAFFHPLFSYRPCSATDTQLPSISTDLAGLAPSQAQLNPPWANAPGATMATCTSSKWTPVASSAGQSPQSPRKLSAKHPASESVQSCQMSPSSKHHILSTRLHAHMRLCFGHRLRAFWSYGADGARSSLACPKSVCCPPSSICPSP